MKKDFVNNFRKYFIFGSGERFIKLYIHANPCLEKGSIIDIETTGLHPRISHVLTLGIYQKDLIRIYQLVKPDYQQFLQVCRKILEKTPTPRCAYAAHFEQQFLDVKNGWQDLTRYREVDLDAWEPYYSYRFRLVDITRGPYESRRDWDIEGSEVPETWEKWLRTANPRILAEISYHCMVDLQRERQLI